MTMRIGDLVWCPVMLESHDHRDCELAEIKAIDDGYVWIRWRGIVPSHTGYATVKMSLLDEWAQKLALPLGVAK